MPAQSRLAARPTAPVGPDGRPIARRAVLALGASLGLRGLAAAIGRPALGPDRPPLPKFLGDAPGGRAEALTTRLHLPTGLAVGPAGAVFIADGGRACVRRLDGRDRLTTVVGAEDLPGDAGDGGPADLALLCWCAGLALAPDGAVYIADAGNHRVRRVGPDGTIATVAGLGAPGFAGDGGPAALARLARPEGVAVGPDGALYIADTGNDRVRRVGPDGVIATVAGDGGRRLTRDGEEIVVRFGGDDGPATDAQLNWPSDVAVGPDGNLYIADAYNGRVRRVGPDGVIATVAGGGTPGALGDGGPAGEAWLDLPHGVAVAPDGALLIADSGNHCIRRVDAAGRIAMVAGTGARGFGGDGGPAAAASLHEPWRVAVVADGGLLIADRGNGRVRRVDRSGVIVTVAGTGEAAPEDAPTHPGPPVTA
jgi:DNA-binding beta-propeller fold protein YncE